MINPGLRATGKNVTSLIVKPGAGQLYKVQCFNGNASARFFQIFDSATVPADASVPDVAPSNSVATVTTVTFDFGERGMTFNNGIVIVNSTTQGTKTIGSADSIISCTYS